MDDNKKIKMKKIGIIALLLLLITVIGATYAYFTAQRGTGGSADIEVGAGTTDSLTFNNDEGNINIIANQDNFGKSNETLKETATVKAKLVPNNNTNEAHETYNIFLVIENNDLEYTKNRETPELLLKITDPENHEYLKAVEGLKYVDNVKDKNDVIYKGYDITEGNNQVYKIVSDYPIVADGTEMEQTWQIEVDLINLDQDQNKNTGKTFEGSIYITSEKDLKLNEVNTLKTVSTSNSIEATANITEGTSGVDKYYFAIEKTNETPETVQEVSVAKALAQDYQEQTEDNYTFNEEIEENQNYKIYTYAVDKKGYKSNIYETVVTAKDGEIPEVGEVTTTSTYNSITINFPSEEGIEYRVRLDNGDWTEFSSKKSHTFEELVMGSTHKVYIQAKNSDNVSNIKVMTLSTLEYINPVVKKIDISDISTSGFTAKATVESGSEEISKVEFQTSNEEDWHDGVKNEDDGTYSFTFTNLDEATEYIIIVKVTSIGLGGVGQSSTTVQTLEIPKENLANFIISKVGKPAGNSNEVLLQHTAELPNSAGDNSYRYSGNNPNNFVCFGNGSEKYNNGEKTCPDTNLYRIIGVFGDQVKLIKSEYITSEELGIQSTGTPRTGDYDEVKRIKKVPTEGFLWTEALEMVWESSTLKEALNNGYFNFLGETWTGKIAESTWHVGGHDDDKLTAKEMYDIEINSDSTVSAPIGLMYASDYGFASEQNSWNYKLSEYNDTNNKNRENNWLFNNVMEWTISPYSGRQYFIFVVHPTGTIAYYEGYATALYGPHATRPVFYLNNDVKIRVDEATGDVDHPYRIVV